MRPNDRLDRRGFLRQSTAAAVLCSTTPTAAWAGSANDRLNVAHIGLGGMGRGHLGWFAKRPDVRVVALCDVDENHLQKANRKAPSADTAGDFREVVARDDVDAVVVATPDHWHGLIAAAAARAGKHVYCEKPLTNSIAEGRAVANAVADAGVVLQTGSHERSNPGASVAKRLVEEGKLGEIKLVRIHLPNSEAHLQEVENFSTPPPDTDPPAGLDYNFWLGPAEAAPYNEKRCHFWWRFHSKFGGGEITDRGAHVIDLAHMILGLDDAGPTRVRAKGKRPAGDFYDAFITFSFECDYAGGLRMVGGNDGPRGLTLEGEAGKLFVGVHGCNLKSEPASLLEGVDLPKIDPYDAHRSRWINAIRGQGAANAPAEAGHRTASACHLINHAMITGAEFDWDSTTEQASDDRVNARLAPSMRPPWNLG